MRSIIAILCLVFSFNSVVWACSCIGTTFCESLEHLRDNDLDIIFKGSFIQSEASVGIFIPMQFKVDKLYHGKIITPSSTFHQGDKYMNTDSTVWIMAGNSSICMPDISEEPALIGVTYRQVLIVDSEDFSYSSRSCFINYLPISPDNTVSGWLNEPFVTETTTLEQLEETILTECQSSISAVDKIEAEDFIVFPQPTSGILSLTTPGNLSQWEIKILDLTGQEVAEIYDNEVDISDINPGVYFVNFVKNRDRYTRKIIKL